MTTELIQARVVAEIEITVGVDVATNRSFADDVIQAVQDAVGHTGALVLDATDWSFLPENVSRSQPPIREDKTADSNERGV